MSRYRSPLRGTDPRSLRVLLVVVVLCGLIGQLVLMAGALPGEVPRATLERLTGLVVTDAPVMDMPEMGMSETGLAGMDMSGMDMPGMRMAHEADGVRHVARDGHPVKPGHDGQAACFLCPLLVLAPAIFMVLPVLLLPRLLARLLMRGALAARAPPGVVRISAFPRGPPVGFLFG